MLDISKDVKIGVQVVVSRSENACIEEATESQATLQIQPAPRIADLDAHQNFVARLMDVRG